MLKTVLIPTLSVLLLSLTVACDRLSVPWPKGEEKKVFKMDPSGDAMEEEELPEVAESKTVHADFNLDQLEDVAVIEKDRWGRSRISIFLQQASDAETKQYIKAGGIQLKGNYTITALMSQVGADHSDLILIVDYKGRGKEFIHYRSEGSEFREILRKPLGGE